MTIDVWSALFFVVAVILSGLAAYWRFSGKSSPGGDIATDLAKALRVAQDAVQAAEQLWVSGQIEQGDRFDWVYNQLKPLFPGLTKEALTMTIEAAVFWLKTSGLTERLKEATSRPGPTQIK